MKPIIVISEDHPVTCPTHPEIFERIEGHFFSNPAPTSAQRNEIKEHAFGCPFCKQELELNKELFDWAQTALIA